MLFNKTRKNTTALRSVPVHFQNIGRFEISSVLRIYFLVLSIITDCELLNLKKSVFWMKYLVRYIEEKKYHWDLSLFASGKKKYKANTQQQKTTTITKTIQCIIQHPGCLYTFT